MTDQPATPKLDNWKYRRRAVMGSLLFSAGMLVYLVGWAPDDMLRRSIAEGLLYCATAIVLGYIFGAVLDDWKRPKT